MSWLWFFPFLLNIMSLLTCSMNKTLMFSWAASGSPETQQNYKATACSCVVALSVWVYCSFFFYNMSVPRGPLFHNQCQKLRWKSKIFPLIEIYAHFETTRVVCDPFSAEIQLSLFRCWWRFIYRPCFSGKCIILSGFVSVKIISVNFSTHHLNVCLCVTDAVMTHRLL